MSVQSIASGNGAGFRGGPSTGRDTLIIFGGWGGVRDWDVDLASSPQTGTTSLLGELRALFAGAAVHAFDGSISAMSTTAALQAIKRSFDPGGRIIIYGYSVGGANAVALARRIGQEMTYYDYEKGSFLSLSPARQGLGLVRVDLLITVDASLGPMSGQNFIPACVRRCLNYYQSHPSNPPHSTVGSQAHGQPATAENPGRTHIRNIDLSGKYLSAPGSAHGKIDNDTLPSVLTEVLSAIQ